MRHRLENFLAEIAILNSCGWHLVVEDPDKAIVPGAVALKYFPELDDRPEEDRLERVVAQRQADYQARLEAERQKEHEAA